MIVFPAPDMRRCEWLYGRPSWFAHECGPVAYIVTYDSDLRWPNAYPACVNLARIIEKHMALLGPRSDVRSLTSIE